MDEDENIDRKEDRGEGSSEKENLDATQTLMIKRRKGI